jgi:alpha/beta superfamily hydrolase
MHNSVVTAIARALVARGMLALRFNFRGVGRSEGQHDDGRGERADVAGALDWLLAQPEVDPWRVSVVGYSFGACVGLAQAQTDPRVAAVAAVGLVAQHCDADLLQAFTRPKLFVTGEYDQLAPIGALQKLVDRLPPPKTLHVALGTDHFWRGREQEAAALVADFFGVVAGVAGPG